MANVITIELATADINKWLDAKKISDKKRDIQKDTIDTLIDAVCEGLLVVKDDFTLEQTLKFPIGDKQPISKLEYKPRLKVESIHMHLQGIKPSDADGRLLAHVAALTTKTKAELKQLDSEDYSISQSIAVFFLG